MGRQILKPNHSSRADCPHNLRDSIAPPGLVTHLPGHPALTRWAIFWRCSAPDAGYWKSSPKRRRIQKAQRRCQLLRTSARRPHTTLSGSRLKSVIAAQGSPLSEFQAAHQLRTLTHGNADFTDLHAKQSIDPSCIGFADYNHSHSQSTQHCTGPNPEGNDHRS